MNDSKKNSALKSIFSDARTIIVAIIGGVILAYIIQDARFAPQAVTDGSESATATPIVVNLGSGNLQISQGQMLLVAGDKGAAAIEFIFGPEDAAYKWRYHEFDSGKETAGTDRVYEDYARTPVAPSEFRIVDEGGVLSVVAGDIQVEWSRKGPASGWIYYDHLGVLVLDDQHFDTINLATVLLDS